jgi:hypothetical protein
MRRRQAITRVPPRSSWILAAASALGLVLGVVPVSADERDFLVVAGAEDVQEYRFDQTYWQVSYKVELEFPRQAISTAQEAELRAAGWIQCRGWRPGWDHFVDASVAPSRLVHQAAMHWLKGNRMIMIAMRYSSSAEARTQSPDNRTQRVYVVFDDDVQGHGGFADLGLDCS